MNCVPAVIIAAGSSSRLGRPKQLVVFEGEKLLERAIRVALESGAQPVFVVLGANRAEIEAAMDLSAVRLIVNENWQEGMASSIRSGIKALENHSPDASGVLLMVCDQPRLTTKHLERMLAGFRRSSASAIASRYAGKRGIPAIFPRAAFGELLALRGDQGARRLLSDARRKVIEIELDGGELDVDRTDDITGLQRL